MKKELKDIQNKVNIDAKRKLKVYDNFISILDDVRGTIKNTYKEWDNNLNEDPAYDILLNVHRKINILRSDLYNQRQEFLLNRLGDEDIRRLYESIYS